jgi:hypothetical protein
MRPAVFSCLVLVCSGVQTGCETSPNTDVAPAGVPVDVQRVRRLHEQRVSRLEQFWSRSVVEIEWTDDQGRHFEQGDGPLIFRRPANLALAIGKLGNILYWLGGDASRWWSFDLNARPTTAHVGGIDSLDRADPRAMPIALRPADLVALLGLAHLPPGDPRPGRPGDPLLFTSADARLEMVVDPFTAHPRRIRLIDASGQVAVESVLAEFIPVKTAGKPPAQWPQIPGEVRLHIPGRKTRVNMSITDAVDGKAGDKVRDAHFDFEQLVQLLRPDRVVNTQAKE